MYLEITNKANPFDDFEKIANRLMNENLLLIGSCKYRLTEIEFYYFNEEDNHADVYAHKHDRQKKNAHWYFHGSGLDITFGNEDKVYGGILIREVKNLSTGGYINGPINCVQEFLSNFGLVNNNEKFNFCLRGIINQEIEYQDIFYCRRVGLNQSKDTNSQYFDSFYRFFIYPQAPHGEKYKIAEDFIKQGKSKQTVNEIFGYKYFKP